MTLEQIIIGALYVLGGFLAFVLFVICEAIPDRWSARAQITYLVFVTLLWPLAAVFTALYMLQARFNRTRGPG